MDILKMVLDNMKPADLAEIGRANGILPLFTQQALAERWGVKRAAVQNRRARHADFPKPVNGFVEGNRPVYPMNEVRRYEQARGLMD